MMMNSLTVLMARLPWNELLTYAWTVPVLGMGVIFSVLALLWGVIEVLHQLLNRSAKEKKAEVKESKETFPEPVAEPEECETEPEDDGAIVAAITVAVSAMLAEEGYTGGFRVVSFRRAGKSNRRMFG